MRHDLKYKCLTALIFSLNEIRFFCVNKEFSKYMLSNTCIKTYLIKLKYYIVISCELTRNFLEIVFFLHTYVRQLFIVGCVNDEFFLKEWDHK